MKRKKKMPLFERKERERERERKREIENECHKNARVINILL